MCTRIRVIYRNYLINMHVSESTAIVKINRNSLYFIPRIVKDS